MAPSLTVIIVFISLSLYNVIELVCIILATFKRYAGLYFWSFIITTSGIFLRSGGFIIKFWGPASLRYFSCTTNLSGWVCMVTGQSVVLWSRLHLILDNPRHLKILLWMIIINAILCHGAIIPLAYGNSSPHHKAFITPYTIMDRVQSIIFFIQETLLSSIYIIETIRLMRLERAIGNTKTSRRLMKHLILVNVVIILLDISVLTLKFTNQNDYQILSKLLVYSIKLKCEFTILNRLVEITTGKKDANFNLTMQDFNTPTTTKTGIALDTFTVKGYSKPSPTSGVSDQAYKEEEGEGSNHREKTSPAEDDIGVISHGKERRSRHDI